MDFVHDIAVKANVKRLTNIRLHHPKLYDSEEVKKRGGEALRLSHPYFTLFCVCIIMFCLPCLDV